MGFYCIYAQLIFKVNFFENEALLTNEKNLFYIFDLNLHDGEIISILLITISNTPIYPTMYTQIFKKIVSVRQGKTYNIISFIHIKTNTFFCYILKKNWWKQINIAKLYSLHFMHVTLGIAILSSNICNTQIFLSSNEAHQIFFRINMIRPSFRFLYYN